MSLPCFASLSLVGDLGDMMTSTAISEKSFSLVFKNFSFLFFFIILKYTLPL